MSRIGCPIPNTHRRLEDCHRLWHRAADSYDRPDEFRADLNALLEALRNVTFVLQAEKSAIPGFDEWYPEWQEILKADVVLRWLVQARNRVVKQGDLETRSTAIAGIQASWDSPIPTTLEVSPFVSTEELAAHLANTPVPEDVRRQGLLRVERRWVADDLPDFELLDALAHCYGVLRLLVAAAHRQAGSRMHVLDTKDRHLQSPPAPGRDGRHPCMEATSDLRTVTVNLASGAQMSSYFEERPEPDFSDRKLQRRLARIDQIDRPRTDDLFAWAAYFMEVAREVLAKDKYHVFLLAVFHDDNTIKFFYTVPDDQQAKYMFLEDVGRYVNRFPTRGVIAVSDAWYVEKLAEIPEGRRAGDSPTRKEALVVTALLRDGTAKTFRTPYVRKLGRIRFAEVQEADGEPVFLAPLYRAWGLEPPSERELVSRLEGIETKEQTDGASE